MLRHERVKVFIVAGIVASFFLDPTLHLRAIRARADRRVFGPNKALHNAFFPTRTNYYFSHSLSLVDFSLRFLLLRAEQAGAGEARPLILFLFRARLARVDYGTAATVVTRAIVTRARARVTRILLALALLLLFFFLGFFLLLLCAFLLGLLVLLLVFFLLLVFAADADAGQHI